MRLNWNEIRVRAAKFAKEWKEAGYEKGETHSFYNDFFEVFGIKRRSVSVYERRVEKLNNATGFIDLFWPGVLIVEQKSVGRDLNSARTQAEDYTLGLKEHEKPRYLLVSDFQNFELFDLDEGTECRFTIEDLPRHVEAFGFIIGVQKRTFQDQDPANIQAAELMGRVHDSLLASGYDGHELEQFLVRLLFCLFADDTGIFEPRGIFQDLVEHRTREDGSDLGSWLAQLFDVLNTPENKRYKTLDSDLAEFPYINGDLFSERLPIPAFDSGMRAVLIEACEFSWEAISPAIFGSLFQSVMNQEERRDMGAHYTTEKNILKVIEPLFLEDLRAEFNHIKSRKTRKKQLLTDFHEKLSKLCFFDPACGCGNFLVIAYRELRLLEMDLLRELHQSEQLEFDARALSLLDVDQFYGIEISEFPARIAEVAMWMMDHIMNNALSMEFGLIYLRIPLTKSPRILLGNALDMDWANILPPNQCSFIMGNPPFRGHQYRTDAQKEDMARVWGTQGQVNRLDYVTCWFKIASDYSRANTAMRIGLVSTNSITQGEQVGILWPEILNDEMSIFFAHRTFQWNSEARGKAAVHCVIIGLTRESVAQRLVFDYSEVRGDPHVSVVQQLNGYLIDGPAYLIPARSRPPAGRLQLGKGSQPTDGARLKNPNGGYLKFSNLILEESDKKELLAAAPEAEKWLRPYVGGEELISGQWRWCLWLKGVDPGEYKNSKAIVERLERVRRGRLLSPTESVREYAKYPMLFTQDRQPDRPYLALPEVSSENREYIPMDMLEPEIIASNKLQIIPNATLLYFAILTSAMHMAWMRTVGGRLESRYSYAPAIYNSFPWPEITPKQEKLISSLAKNVLDTRAVYRPEKSLDDLYDSDWMPADLRKAHQRLDTAVDRLYRKVPFKSERERVEHLFMRYGVANGLTQSLAP